MLRSALGIVISLFIFVAAAHEARAERATVPKPAAKKQAAGKSVQTKRKTVVAKRARVDGGQSGQRAAGLVKAAPRRSTRMVAPAVLTAGEMAGLHRIRDRLALKSNAALVVDQDTFEVLFDKNSAVPLPIASLTKLMTALVVVEARQEMDEVLEVTADDIDRERNSSSRLRVGAQMTRADMLHIALMSSENRAASALGRHFPGGLPAFVAAMNAKAKALGMRNTRFVDPTGLSSNNVASAWDLAKLASAAHKHPVIREYSTYPRYAVDAGGYRLQYMNSNRLVLNPNWEIGLQKTGYISEAGRCLLMQASIEGRAVVMVLLDSKGKDSRLGDAGRIRKWLEMSTPEPIPQTAARQS